MLMICFRGKLVRNLTRYSNRFFKAHSRTISASKIGQSRALYSPKYDGCAPKRNTSNSALSTPKKKPSQGISSSRMIDAAIAATSFVSASPVEVDSWRKMCGALPRDGERSGLGMASWTSLLIFFWKGSSLLVRSVCALQKKTRDALPLTAEGTTATQQLPSC
jgi:hypothetical protein